MPRERLKGAWCTPGRALDPAGVAERANETGSNLGRTANRNSEASKARKIHRKFAKLLFAQ
jgi:hypothetical protein